MYYIEAPTEYDGSRPSIFLAGGISGCEDWQTRMAERLSGTSLVILNPRRRAFPMGDPDAAEEQIGWEFRHLRRATARLFWFPPQTLCPIALYELGASSVSPGRLFVGVHSDYSRRRDVEVQMRLARPEVQVVYSPEQLAEQVRAWAAARRETLG